MQFRAEATHVPGIALQTEQVSRYGVGPSQAFPSNVAFEAHTIQFFDDSKTTIWKFFAQWINAIFNFAGGSNGTSGNYGVAYRADYVVDIKIHVFNTEGTLIKTVVLKDAFPLSLGEVALSWSEQSSLYKFPVTFGYQYWYLESPQSSGLSGLPPAPTGAGSPPTPPPLPVLGTAPVGEVVREDLPPIPGGTASPDYNQNRTRSQFALDALRQSQQYSNGGIPSP